MLEIQATGQNVDFPIAFTEWCVACGSRVTGTGGNPTTLGANAAFSELATLTYARVFSVETQDYYLLAAGVQQWGIVEHIKQETRATATFPIPFTQNNFAVLPVIFGWESVDDTISAYCISKTLTEAVLIADTGQGITGINYADILYAAIGQQQASRYQGHYRQNPKIQSSQHH